MKYLIHILIVIMVIGCDNNPDHKDIPPEQLELLWEYSYSMRGWGPEVEPTVVGDSLILMAGDEYITCLQLENGVVKWKQLTTDGNVASLFNFLFDDTQVYGWQNRAIYALDVQSGNYNWIVDSTGYYRYHGFSQSYYYSPYGSKFYKISKNGQVVDTTVTSYPIRALAYYRNKIYSGQYWPTGDGDIGRITCYDEKSLDSLWSYDEPGGGFNMCYPVFDNGVLYAGTVWGGSLGNEVLALNAETGAKLWSTDSYGVYQIVLGGDVLYYAGGASVNALDKYTGQVIWRTIIPTTDQSSPLAYWDGYVYKAHAGTLLILDAETGEIVEHLRGPDNAYIYQVSVGAGKIFVQSSRHLYAFAPYEPGR